MHHSISGSIFLNEEKINLNKGLGYTEKDWGKNFPQSWIWVQANHFKKDKISLSASIARISLLGTKFAGFIIGLLVGDKLYRFTTYRSAKIISLSIKENDIEWIIKQKKMTLIINISLGKKSGLLFAPGEKDMIRKVNEHLDSTVSFKLKSSNKTIIEDKSNYAASEVVGDIEALLELANRS